MDPALLFRGVLIGLAIAAPVGPIGILCIRRTLSAGRIVGLITGLGAATADALYGAIAAFGLSLLTNFLIDHQGPLRIVGGTFLIFIGVRTIRAQPATEAATIQGKGLLGAYLSTFFLTLTNPLTILSFAGIFTGLGATGERVGGANPMVLVLGVFLGSAAWWLFLSSAVSFFRKEASGDRFRWINWTAGVILVVFGIAALFQFG
jgi:threonine/homoserine/homoserine lactone efflux protein